jgi:glycosyltransferase involved in cell wall biosynthesis
LGYGKEEYQQLIRKFGELVRNSVPEASTVLVVSKGDHALLELGLDSLWHFPQRSDGTYTGYYPFDSASAITHLEALREKGGEYLAFPAPSLWWLDHYEEFRRHLERHYQEVCRDEDAGVIYALDGAKGSGRAEHAGRKAGERATARAGVAASTDRNASALQMLVSVDHYSEQAGRAFNSTEEALAHYAKVGQHEGHDPHPLFDTRWYLAQNPEIDSTSSHPLLHFLERAPETYPDPNPYFDTEYYYSQIPRVREAGINALAHYLDPGARAAHPNPLFREAFYRDNSRNGLGALTPLEHYLRHGRSEGRATSHVHEKLLAQVRGDCSGLQRGKWTKGTVLWLIRGSSESGWPAAELMADRLAAEHHLGSLVVSYVESAAAADGMAPTRPFVLEDYALACEIFRPAALRLLALALASGRPLFAVCDVPELLRTLAGAGAGCYLLLGEGDEIGDSELEAIKQSAKRVLVTSKAASKSIAKRFRRDAPPVTVCKPPKAGTDTEGYADALLKLARKDFDLPALRARRRPRTARPKIAIPCSDWSVSGVNASLESIGLQLAELGWDIEVVFTRDEAAVIESTHGSALPLLPYRYLERERKGPPGVWHALIGDLESQGPCILFMAYDFLANGVVPALGDRVGAVAWVQADDRDYYEQVYRLGRYCNAIVCVSEVIREAVYDLNPAIGKRAHVIHNSSIREGEIAHRRGRRENRMRLVYTGRLVQYQKRILDFVALAEALDRTGAPYEITLIGTFSSHDKTEEEFEQLAAAQIADGRIVLPGRMSRAEILRALTHQDFFVLLSDFEGLPLSLVEAMARGCVPVVAESPSGIPEVLESGKNGHIVSGRDYDAWAKLLADLWRDRKACTEMSRHARATVRDKFTVEHVGAQFDELFRSVGKEICSGRYKRPRSLNWGGDRSHAGDVLPPPNLFRPACLQIPGLQ